LLAGGPPLPSQAFAAVGTNRVVGRLIMIFAASSGGERSCTEALPARSEYSGGRFSRIIRNLTSG
jgi:hypothetical protein